MRRGRRALGHHASLPLAFAILYQDYPFALADLFLKRALALLALVAIAFVAIAHVRRRVGRVRAVRRSVDPRQVGVLVTLWVATALLYPALRRGDRLVRRRDRPAPARLPLAARDDRRAASQSHDDVPALLDDVCDAARRPR